MSAALGVERSYSGRRWQFAEADEDTVRALSLATNVPPVVARLLASRGVSESQVELHLNPSIKALLPEPFLLTDMDQAVERAQHAIATGEQIAIFGDYDVDGSCSAALLRQFFAAIGRDASVYVPDRLREGYGPSENALLRLRQEGASLVITVDCGATAEAPLRAAKIAGLDVIVLDHHAVEDANGWAYPHVNPNQPADCSGLHQLCAAAIAFLFAVALNRRLRESGWYASNAIAEPDLRQSLDLVGLATICDVAPLTGVNRAFVRAGLARAAARPGLRVLAGIAGAAAPFSSHDFGFVLGPRINAGGRVGRCGLGVDLLSAADDATAAPLAMMLDRHNRERQAIEAVILEGAIAQASLQDNAPFVLVAGEGWHSGVVGIVAGRLKERFGRPALAVAMENGIGRGSARSIPGIDIGALLRRAREEGLLQAAGGHAMAAGFSLSEDKIGLLSEFLGGALANAGSALAEVRTLKLDAVLSPSGATQALLDQLGRAGPFGAGNPEPFLAAPDVRIAFAASTERGHIRMTLEGGDGGRLVAIAFRACGSPLGDALLKNRGRPIHAAGTLKADTRDRKGRVQLVLEDAAPAGV
jgi:single-stranded-DNA-specific exonuclease